MGTPTHDQQPTADAKHAKRPARDADSNDAKAVPTVDPMMRSLEKDHGLAAPEGGQRAVSENEHRMGLIVQFGELRNSLLFAVNQGIIRGTGAISKPEGHPHGDTASFLALAASLVLAGSAGSVAVAVGSVIGLAGKALVEQAARKFVEDSVKDAVKQAFHGVVAAKPTELSDLKEAFSHQLQAQLTVARFQLAASWSEVNDRLASLATPDLEHLVRQPVDLAAATTILDTVADQTVIAWTNFLAQAMHGAMAPRDPWTPRPGAGTSGFDPQASQVGAHAANVDPHGLNASLELTQGAVEEETYGVLEVFLTTRGTLLESPGYGVRLDHAGPGCVRGCDGSARCATFASTSSSASVRRRTHRRRWRARS